MAVAPLSAIPAFVEAPLENIPTLCKETRDTFFSGRTRDIEWRKKQLRKLYWAVKDNEKIIADAMLLDLGKPPYESYVMEIYWIMNEIVYILNNLDSILADEKLYVKLMFKAMKPRTEKVPFGTVLVIAPFNFPFQLALGPAIGAIAAGNTVIIKPSENTPATSAVIAALVEKYLDNNAFKVVIGGIPETTALLAEKWDKIFYTGNGHVARIVSQAAIKHLTPVVLELGGKNPAFITKNADAKLAGKRLAWGKVMNDGQVCLAPDFAIVHPSKKDEFIQSVIATWKDFFPRGAENSKDISRIINLRSFLRIKKLLDNTKGKIVAGGYTNEAKLFIEPTIVVVEDEDDALLGEEIFGPILAVIVRNSTQEALEIARRLGDCSLATYVFSNDKKEVRQILSETRSGGATINDVIMHGGINTLPFGGVGESGTGTWHGVASVETFTHNRTVTETPSWVDSLLKIRHAPFTAAKLNKSKGSNAKAEFDRDGNVSIGLLKKVFTLGAGRFGPALWRYLVLVVGVWGLLGKMRQAKL